MKISDTFRHEFLQLFRQMDQAYADSAGRSGFVCNGCGDNCCLTRFYHHTLVEYLYIKSGMAELDPGVRDKVAARAGEVLAQMADLDRPNSSVRVMCPLNEAGRCILYAHRPMICRLHGIAHSLRRPDGQLQAGPGCEDFYAQCGRTCEVRLDRTPFYIEMAALEQRLRAVAGYRGKIKMTIAEIVLDKSVKCKGVVL